MNYWDFLQVICDDDIPLPDKSKFSPDLISLLDSCLQKDPSARITIKRLLEHEYFSNHTDSILDNSQQAKENAVIALGGEEDEGAVEIDKDIPMSPGALDGNRSTLSKYASRHSAKITNSSDTDTADNFEMERVNKVRRDHLVHLLTTVEKRSAHFDNSAISPFQPCNSGSSQRTARVNATKAPPKLPNFSRQHWNHLADQLHLPLSVVVEAAKEILNSSRISTS